MNWYGLPTNQLIASLLLKSGVVSISIDKPFTLASGKLSPIYFDCRKLISVPSGLNIVISLFQWFIENSKVNFDIIAGGESAGIPYASRLAGIVGKPMIYIRKKAKEYGKGSYVEGTIIKSANVLLVEDLITDGGSKLVFINGIRESGMKIDHCLVLLDREQGGYETLKKDGIQLHSLIKANDVLKAGLELDMININDYNKILEYLNIEK